MVQTAKIVYADRFYLHNTDGLVYVELQGQNPKEIPEIQYIKPGIVSGTKIEIIQTMPENAFWGQAVELSNKDLLDFLERTEYGDLEFVMQRIETLNPKKQNGDIRKTELKNRLEDLFKQKDISSSAQLKYFQN